MLNYQRIWNAETKQCQGHKKCRSQPGLQNFCGSWTVEHSLKNYEQPLNWINNLAIRQLISRFRQFWGAAGGGCRGPSRHRCTPWRCHCVLWLRLMHCAPTMGKLLNVVPGWKLKQFVHVIWCFQLVSVQGFDVSSWQTISLQMRYRVFVQWFEYNLIVSHTRPLPPPALLIGPCPLQTLATSTFRLRCLSEIKVFVRSAGDWDLLAFFG